MKKAFLHIGSLFLALLVLFSTFSFTLETHLCAGEVADTSFLGNLERCEMPNSEHNETQETSLQKIPCCQDIVETIESSNDELTVVKELDVQEQQIVAALLFSYIHLFEGIAQQPIFIKGYDPPRVSKDIQVLYDTFLI